MVRDRVHRPETVHLLGSPVNYGELPALVDFHSHLVPSGDDGVTTIDEAVALCEDAATRGTEILYVTPHVNGELPLTPAREAAIIEALEKIRRRVALDLRLGYEVTPHDGLDPADLGRYALQDTRAVLLHAPIDESLAPLRAAADALTRVGLTPVIAHPEWCSSIIADPRVAVQLSETGCLLQIDALSLFGRYYDLAEQIAWMLIEEGLADLVASDGHSARLPPALDAAFVAVHDLIGAAAIPLFDGSALGIHVRGGADSGRA